MRDFFTFVWKFFAELDIERHAGIFFLILICGLCWIVPYESALPIVIALGLASG